MKIVKVAYQGTDSAHETAYIVKGLFRKKVYRIDFLSLVELPTQKQGATHEKTT